MSRTDIALQQVEFSGAQAAIEYIRRTVFIEEQHVPEELEWDGEDAQAIHLLARSGEEPVATARLLRNGHIGRMAVLPVWRGQGIGMAMLKQLLDIARQRQLTRVYLNAQLSAVDFYARVGFIVEGETFMDAGIAHKRMVLEFE